MSWLELRCRHRYPGGASLELEFEISAAVAALFGPSGSGKTSALAAVAGLLRPREGLVRLGGRTVLDTSRRIDVAPERRAVAMVFQDLLLFPHLTVERNLRYGQCRAGRRPVELARVVEVLEIGPLLDRYPRGLSGGEKQRVALGRALLSGPEVLLMDEPLAALDARLKDRVLVYLERIAAEWRVPVLFVSHSQSEVKRLAEWVVAIDRGRVVAAGPPAEALSRPEPLAWAGGTGPANLLRIEHVVFQDDHALGQVGGNWLYLPRHELPGRLPVFVEFHPRDVTLARRDPEGLSARNHLRGRVCQIVPLEHTVFLAVDIGQVLWAEVTIDAARELALETGAEVVCLLKAQSLRVLG